MHIMISCHGIGFNISSTKVIVLLQDSQIFFYLYNCDILGSTVTLSSARSKDCFHIKTYQNTFSVEHKSRIAIPNKVSHVTSQKKKVTGEELCSLLQFKQTTYLPTDYVQLSFRPSFFSQLGGFPPQIPSVGKKQPNNNKTTHRNQGIPDWS